EHQTADLGFDALEHLLALALRMQHLARAAGEDLAGPNGDDAVLDRDGGEVEVLPTTLSEEIAGQVVLVQALHDHADRISFLVVEARDQAAAVPVDHAPARWPRHRLFGLERIVDYDEIGSPPRERAADRGSVAAAAGGGDELGAGILCGAHSREEGSIPG